MTETTSVLGGTVRRKEDPALIRGTGTYTDDVKLPGQLVAAFVRSPFAHARILSVDADEAKSMDGVWAVYTADDVRDLGPLLAQVPVGQARPLLGDGVVKHVGEAVVMVVAENRYLAQDAADAVFVDYDPLPAVVDMKAARTDTVKVHEGLDSNTIITWSAHDWWPGVIELEDAAPAIAAAKQRDDAIVVTHEMANQRLIPTAIEPRSVVASWNPGYGRFDVVSSSQIPHALAGAIATTFGIGSNMVHATAPEVGGGFGAKLNVYNDEILVCFASKDLGRPVKFTETRREAATSTIQGRGWVATATIVGTRDGEILGYEFEGIADMGAYSQNFTAAIPLLGLWVSAGQYNIPVSWVIHCVHTHTQTTDAYRGAGRPEALYYIERMVDAYAREIGMDPADVRKRNFWGNDQFPATNNTGLAIDSGDYATNLDVALELADYEGLKAMQAAARADGKYIGIG
ncbi:MAG: molybdopterin-dependent oxidoreductase, partial [Acidimicrobiia bacterium]|nr:molybdopterin-dependent oxidoreductase [Acidimicrobiia bacterium]